MTYSIKVTTAQGKVGYLFVDGSGISLVNQQGKEFASPGAARRFLKTIKFQKEVTVEIIDTALAVNTLV